MLQNEKCNMAYYVEGLKKLQGYINSKRDDESYAMGVDSESEDL